MVEWAWDQGRQKYFRFEAIRTTAGVFVALDGTDLSTGDPLRVPLTEATGLSYPPDDRVEYPVQRNFKRVFKEQLLAGFGNDALRVTDVCRLVDPANPNAWTVDDYFAFLIPRFYMPSPARNDYSAGTPVVYPICALVRYLLEHEAASLDDILGKVIGNSAVGDEPPDFYRNLVDTGHRGTGDEPRQVREMIRFFVQASWLDEDQGLFRLLLGPAPEPMRTYVRTIASPIIGARLADSDDEVVRLGSVTGIEPAQGPRVLTRQPSLPILPEPQIPPVATGTLPPAEPSDGYNSDEDREFTEGKKTRVSHLKTERSAKLKREWARRNGAPQQCDICSLRPLEHYPWMSMSGLHLHHILPLSSSVHTALTAITDVVALCGPCHSAVHAFYRDWLNRNDKDDFTDKAEAHTVYGAAKGAYVT